MSLQVDLLLFSKHDAESSIYDSEVTPYIEMTVMTVMDVIYRRKVRSNK